MSPDRDKPITTSSLDRRSSKRHSAVDFVWYKVLKEKGSEQYSSLEGVSKMCDISKTGIGIYVTQKLPVGQYVFLELAANKLNLSAVGEIVSDIRIKENYYRVGIRFTIIPPNDRMTLTTVLKENEKE